MYITITFGKEDAKCFIDNKLIIKDSILDDLIEDCENILNNDDNELDNFAINFDNSDIAHLTSICEKCNDTSGIFWHIKELLEENE